MCRNLITTCLLLALSLVTWAEYEQPRKHHSRKVFFEARKHQTNYVGPGREERSPANIKEVLIGYFGPRYKGLPFRLVAGWSDNPWSSGVSKVVRMAYMDRVWAVIGGIDGPSTHLAEQVAAKARLTLLSPASTDKTVNLANVPWMFSCLPGDHLQMDVFVPPGRSSSSTGSGPGYCLAHWGKVLSPRIGCGPRFTPLHG
jgi:hypothetical protein